MASVSELLVRTGPSQRVPDQRLGVRTAGGVLVVVHTNPDVLDDRHLARLAAGAPGPLGDDLTVGGDPLRRHTSWGRRHLSCAGQPQHLRAERAEGDGHFRRLEADADAIEVDRLAVVGDGLAGQQGAHRGQVLAHRADRPEVRQAERLAEGPGCGSHRTDPQDELAAADLADSGSAWGERRGPSSSRPGWRRCPGPTRHDVRAGDRPLGADVHRFAVDTGVSPDALVAEPGGVPRKLAVLIPA